MPANPTDIAKYTQDGELLTYQDGALKTAHPIAKDQGEIPTYFRYSSDAALALAERGVLLGQVGKLHDAIEVDRSLGIGSAITVSPQAPTFTLIDDTRNLNAPGRLRAVVTDFENERFSVEMIG